MVPIVLVGGGFGFGFGGGWLRERQKETSIRERKEMGEER